MPFDIRDADDPRISEHVDAAARARNSAVKGVERLRGGRYAHEVAQIDALAAIQHSLEALRLEIRRVKG